ncbi:hypothetical protein PR048_027916 [Dryococelus australis]|uniref:Integrase catalytic domain-containing protein n=1 Tax=Dryococelus australis TaxID=614101 RepID=A0ABQ9GHS5_9NEOP|nr:hypothetical protein PR048_027916 [Dryococelus australis]
MEEVLVGIRRHMWFQHDGAPAYFTLAVREFLSDTFGHLWIGRGGPVPRSADLTKMVFYLWGYMKWLVCETPVGLFMSLTARIHAAAAHVQDPQNVITATEDRMLSRCRLCIREGGHHLEQFLELCDQLLYGINCKRLACSPLTKANRFQFPAWSLPDFLMWESCRTMSLVDGFSRRFPVFTVLSFRCRSIPTSITLIGSQDLAVKNRPNLFTTHSHSRARRAPFRLFELGKSPLGARQSAFRSGRPTYAKESRRCVLAGNSRVRASELRRPCVLRDVRQMRRP